MKWLCPASCFATTQRPIDVLKIVPSHLNALLSADTGGKVPAVEVPDLWWRGAFMADGSTHRAAEPCVPDHQSLWANRDDRGLAYLMTLKSTKGQPFF